MASMMSSILRAATRGEGEKLNILTFSAHERLQHNLSTANVNFFCVQGGGLKEWNPVYAPVPANHMLLQHTDGKVNLPLDVDFDLVWVHNKLAHYGLAHGLAHSLHLPILVIEHCLPPPGWGAAELAHLKGMRGHVNTFISAMSRGAWGWSEQEAAVIHHGVDTELFSPCPTIEKKRYAFSAVNDWVNRDVFCGYSLWRRVTEGLPVCVLGDTPGLSRPARSLAELVSAYREAQVFLNTSLISPIPTVLLEAMSVGCACVSTANCLIPDIIQNGVNGFLSNDPNELREYVKLLLEDADLARRLGEAARRTILESFPLSRFVREWDEAFRTTANVTYRG